MSTPAGKPWSTDASATTAQTFAPISSASCTASEPTAPLAPVTITRSPSRTRATSCNATQAEVQGEKKAEPSAMSRPSGSSPSAASGASAISHQVPSNCVPRPLPRSHTRWPGAKRSLWTTMPAPSTPGV
nr:hypothetical protein [Variovorax sp.]